VSLVERRRSTANRKAFLSQTRCRGTHPTHLPDLDCTFVSMSLPRHIPQSSSMKVSSTDETFTNLKS
jgi:hypothetical protein